MIVESCLTPASMRVASSEPRYGNDCMCELDSSSSRVLKMGNDFACARNIVMMGIETITVGICMLGEAPWLQFGERRRPSMIPRDRKLLDRS